MTGHQLEWWHAGILAKFLAGDACPRRERQKAARVPRRFQRLWVAVDQDDNDPGVPRAGGPGGRPGRFPAWSMERLHQPAPADMPIGFRPVSGVSPWYRRWNRARAPRAGWRRSG